MKKLRLQAIAAICFFVINAAVYVLRLGGIAGLTIISNSSAILASLVAAVACIYALRSFVPEDKRRKGWLLWALGFFLYFLGELTWGIYEVVLRIPIPFPSVADLFWLGGYVPLFFGLANGYRFAGAEIKRKQTYLMWVLLMTAFVVLTAFLFIPIIRDTQTSLIEKVLDSAYPIGDLFLLAPVLAIALLFRRSLLGKPWLYICLGFASFSVADSVFSYLTHNGIYRMGSFIDLVWLGGYLLFALGASYQRIVNEAGY